MRRVNMSDNNQNAGNPFEQLKAQQAAAPVATGNPLQKYFRQPKIYLQLPSHGRFYSEGVLDKLENNEYPVFPMTAKDELMFKTPDALLNGQATVDVIKSCIPNIKDPWQMPSIDIDACLIAIRMATYGEELSITTKVPGLGEERAFTVDLKTILDKIINTEFEWTTYSQDLKINLRPLTYREFTNNALKTFEEQRILNVVNDDSLPDEEKLQRFANSFSKLTGFTVNIVTQGISSIEVDGNVVNNKDYIAEFVDNADKTFFKNIMDLLESNKAKASIKPLKVVSSEEDVAAGAPKEWEVPITFDQSNFFA